MSKITHHCEGEQGLVSCPRGVLISCVGLDVVLQQCFFGDFPDTVLKEAHTDEDLT